MSYFNDYKHKWEGKNELIFLTAILQNSLIAIF
ncbi:hypothetical protein SP_0699 [Streptococcus pneumoniae TIGR4]|uniref:Uncharacterized protein n=1 Tax=Streptococcus pneumoniae serotype 4 (strain ATCC BAA-334 / TIGR4) TaxID=170187 RepID=A0A0H2UP57_STRPN|nr:hypothetical protein SP_0699 [Streptococcus pneumoniae TIGR4]